MIKYLLMLIVVACFINTANAQESNVTYSVSFQPVPAVVSYQVPMVQYVPIVVQKEFWVNTWGFRPILTPNYVFYPNTPVISYPQPVVVYYRPYPLRPWVPCRY